MVLIPNILELSLHRNVGVAFSISIPHLAQLIMFPFLLILGLYVITHYLEFNKPFVYIISGLVAGGAASNFVDRATLQYVVDYISVGSYPVFNLADAFIVVGIFLLVVLYGKIKKV